MHHTVAKNATANGEIPDKITARPSNTPTSISNQPRSISHSFIRWFTRVCNVLHFVTAPLNSSVATSFINDHSPHEHIKAQSFLLFCQNKEQAYKNRSTLFQ